MVRSLRKLYRTAVESKKGKRIGIVREVLFDPAQPVVVGFIVQRPRLLMLLDRKDRYLALDRAVFGETICVPDESGAWDQRAAKRLGLDWEQTVVWHGMPVRTESGEELGSVRDGLFDETGQLTALGLTGGMAADAAVGVRDIAGTLVHGYRDGAIVVADEAGKVQTSGGAAAAAGKGYAVAKDRAAKTVKNAEIVGKAAGKVAGEAMEGAGKKAGGWLRAVRDEFVDGMKDSDEG